MAAGDIDGVPRRAEYLTRGQGVQNVVHVLATHAALVAWFVLGVGLPAVLYVPLSLFGSLVHQRAMSEWIHEAAHRNLVPSRAWNDVLGNALCGVWFALSVATYRATHLDHHNRTAFFLEGDVDTSLFTVTSRRAFRRALVADLTGLTILRQYARFGRSTTRARSRAVYATAVVHLGIATALFAVGRFDALVLYYLALGCLYPALNRLRTYGQHVTVNDDGGVVFAGSTTSRTTLGTLADRIVFTSPRLLYHHEHHAQPHLPWRALAAWAVPSADRNRWADERWRLLRAIYAGLPAE